MNTKIIKILSLLSFLISLITKGVEFDSDFCFDGDIESLYERTDKIHRKIALNNQLFSSSLSKNVDEVQKLLDEGADVNFKQINSTSDNSNSTALSNAVFGANLDVVKCLIYNGANTDSIVTHMSWKNCDILTLAEKCLYEKKYGKEIVSLLKKHKSRVQKIKDNSLKEIAEKVNLYLPKYLQDKLRAQLKVTGLPDVLENMVFDYCDLLYPKDSQKFFELSDETIDEMIDIYFEKIENKKSEKNTSKIGEKRKLENIES